MLFIFPTILIFLRFNRTAPVACSPLRAEGKVGSLAPQRLSQHVQRHQRQEQRKNPLQRFGVHRMGQLDAHWCRDHRHRDNNGEGDKVHCAYGQRRAHSRSTEETETQ